MALLVTGTPQGISGAQLLETGTRQRVTYGQLETGTSMRASYSALLETGTAMRMRTVPRSFTNTFIVPDPAQWDTTQAGEASKLVLPIVKIIFKLYNSGTITDLTPYINDFSLDIVFGGKSSFKVSLIQHSPAGFDDDGYPLPDLWARMAIKKTDLNPLFLGRNAMTNKILSHAFDKSRQAIIEIHTSAPEGVQIWRAPSMLLGTPRLEASTALLQWGGEDFTALLERSGNYQRTTAQVNPSGELPVGAQPLLDIVPSGTSIRMAHATMSMIAAACGITSLRLNFPDYPIRQLRMSSGRPRDWMDEIAQVYQAHSYWVGETLVYEPARRVTEAASWSWVDYLNIMRDTLTIEQTEGWKNRFTLSRLKDQSGVLKAQRCDGGKCVGNQTVTISEPMNFVHIFLRTDVTIAFTQFTFWDVDDRIVQGPGQATSAASATKIAKITFVSTNYYLGGNTAGNQGASQAGGPLTLELGNTNDPNAMNQFIPSYEYLIVGGSEASSLGAFSDTYSLTRQDDTTVALWGRLTDGDNIEMSQIPSASVASAALDALIYENIRKIFSCGFDTPYVNPAILPNSIHDLTHWRSAQENVHWLCEGWKLTQNSKKDIIQSPSFSRGLL